MNTTFKFGLYGLLSALPLAAHAYDYPTIDRVRYVQQCMRDHPGPHFEMTSKCVCVVDALAKRLKPDEFATLSTALDANSIGGERGNSIRDVESLQKDIRRYRELQATLKKGCFINIDAK